MKAVLLILAGGGMTLLSCVAAGRLLCRWLRVEFDGFVRFVLGAAIVSTLVFLITAAGFAHVGEFVALAALLIALGLRIEPRPPAWPATFWAVWVSFGAFYLMHALTPEASPDGVSYHVGLITHYFREHQFSDLSTSYFAGFPAAIEMLFLMAFSVGRHSAAAVVHLGFLLALPFGILAWGRERGHATAGVAGALLVFVTPVIARDGTVAYVDVAVAAIAFALFRVLEAWRDRPSLRLAALAGVLAGFGFASKYPQAIGVLYVALLITWWSRGRWRAALKPLAAFCCGAALMPAPWLIKNVVTLGSPVAPMLNRWFPTPYYHASAETDVLKVVRSPLRMPPVDLALNLAIRGEGVDGVTGPILALLPLAALAVAVPAGRGLLLAGVVFAIPWLGNLSTRFLIAPLVFLLLALALAAARVRYLAALLVAANVIACLPPVVERYSRHGWRLEGLPWRAALRLTPEWQYLSGKLPDYVIGLKIRDIVPEGAQVLTRSMSNVAYQPRELVTDWHSAFGTRMFACLDQAIYEKQRPVYRATFEFPETAAKRVRLALDTCGEEIWAVSEMRLFDRGVELGRGPDWRLRAWPNPWDVRDAFDASPITVWNVRQYHPPQAFIEVEFASGKQLDRVTADLPENLGGCVMHVEVDGAAATNARLNKQTAPYPERYRRAAIEELKANRIRWLVTRGDEPLTQDLLERAEQWGVTVVASEGQFSLFRLD